MGFLVTVLVFGFIGFLVLMGIGGFWAIGSTIKDQDKVKKMEANPDAILEALFDGSPQVVYAPHDTSGGLTMRTLVKGAVDHGYKMVAENGQMATRTVVFDKID